MRGLSNRQKEDTAYGILILKIQEKYPIHTTEDVKKDQFLQNKLSVIDKRSAREMGSRILVP